jgi:hypothetical protein
MGGRYRQLGRPPVKKPWGYGAVDAAGAPIA